MKLINPITILQFKTNNYLKKKTDAKRMLYKKQRNYCVPLLGKSKTNYTNLDEKKVSSNKLFWKVTKPSISDKSCVEEQKYSNFDPVINDAKDPTLRTILNYKDHPNVLAV